MNHRFRISYGDITLRPLAECDIEDLRLWRNDPMNARFIRKLPHITPEMQKAWFETYLKRENEMLFAVDERDGTLVGSVALSDIENGRAEFGKLLVGPFKGHGYGSKITEAILRFAFDSYGLDTVFATVSVGNVAAMRIYSRVGFVITGMQYNESAQMDEYALLLEKARFDCLSDLVAGERCEFWLEGGEDSGAEGRS